MKKPLYVWQCGHKTKHYHRTRDTKKWFVCPVCHCGYAMGKEQYCIICDGRIGVFCTKNKFKYCSECKSIKVKENIIRGRKKQKKTGRSTKISNKIYTSPRELIWQCGHRSFDYALMGSRTRICPKCKNGIVMAVKANCDTCGLDLGIKSKAGKIIQYCKLCSLERAHAQRVAKKPIKLEIENLHRFLYGVCDLCEEPFEGERHYLGKRTPAEIGPICGTCKNTIMNEATHEFKRA